MVRGEAVEDDTFRILEAVQRGSQNVDNQVVGEELALVDVTLGCLAQLGSVLYFGTQHVTCGDVVDAILCYNSLALCALAGTGGTENYNVQHIFI